MNWLLLSDIHNPSASNHCLCNFPRKLLMKRFSNETCQIVIGAEFPYGDELRPMNCNFRRYRI
jgi:hypothetical protein